VGGDHRGGVPALAALVTSVTEQDLPAFCPLGHRIVPSTGECWGMRESWWDGPSRTFFEYVIGDCATVSAACEETAA
jgi:hypothetical protein